MFAYGKTAANAIATISFLAQRMGQEGRSARPATSIEISRNRGISQTLAAKLLTILSQNGMVTGSPGPRGGYWLARDPTQISLFEVVSLFEKTDEWIACPFGKNWCGHQAPCPLHIKLKAFNDEIMAFLQGTTLDVFRETEPGMPAVGGTTGANS